MGAYREQPIMLRLQMSPPDGGDGFLELLRALAELQIVVDEVRITHIELTDDKFLESLQPAKKCSFIKKKNWSRRVGKSQEALRVYLSAD